MRGWNRAGPGHARPDFNYREDIWDHVGAQMALASTDLRGSNLGPAVVLVYIYTYVCSSAASTLRSLVTVAHFKQVN